MKEVLRDVSTCGCMDVYKNEYKYDRFFSKKYLMQENERLSIECRRKEEKETLGHPFIDLFPLPSSY